MLSRKAEDISGELEVSNREAVEGGTVERTIEEAARPAPEIEEPTAREPRRSFRERFEAMNRR